METESFWDDDVSTSDDKDATVYEQVFLIPKNINDLEKEVEMTKEELDYIEILRARKYKQLIDIQQQYSNNMVYSDHPQYNNLLKSKKGKSVIEVSSLNEGKILKLRLDFLLPIYQKIKTSKFSYYETLQNIYREEITKCLFKEKNRIPNFIEAEKVFVIILQYFKNNIISDLDNRFHSIVFNSLRSARIIPDDSWRNLSYMEDGKHTKESAYTEIYICDYREKLQLLSEIYAGE